jgi:hypothetical protein
MNSINKLKLFRIKWINGGSEEVWAYSLRDAFSKLGYGRGALRNMKEYNSI